MSENNLKRAYQLVRKNPDDPEAWINLGNLLQASGDKEKAAQCFQHARQLTIAQIPSPPTQPEETIYCSQCGHANPPVARFCGECGATLVSDKYSSPSPPPSVSPRKKEKGGSLPNFKTTVGNLPEPLDSMTSTDLIKILIGGGILAIIILFSILHEFVALIFAPLYIIPIGYALTFAKQVIDTDQYFPLPLWTNWRDIARKGAIFFLIHVAYLVPSLLLLGITALLIWGIDTLSYELSVEALSEITIMIENFVETIGPFILGLLSLLSWGLADMATCNYLRKEKLAAAFRVIKVFGYFRRAILRLIPGYLLYIVVFLILQAAGCVLCGVGIFASLFIALLLYEAFLAHIYRRAEMSIER